MGVLHLCTNLKWFVGGLYLLIYFFYCSHSIRQFPIFNYNFVSCCKPLIFQNSIIKSSHFKYPKLIFMVANYSCFSNISRTMPWWHAWRCSYPIFLNCNTVDQDRLRTGSRSTFQKSCTYRTTIL